MGDNSRRHDQHHSFCSLSCTIASTKLYVYATANQVQRTVLFDPTQYLPIARLATT